MADVYQTQNNILELRLFIRKLCTCERTENGQKQRHSDWNHSIRETHTHKNKVDFRFWYTFCIWFRNQFVFKIRWQYFLSVPIRKWNEPIQSKQMATDVRQKCERCIESYFLFVLFAFFLWVVSSVSLQNPLIFIQLCPNSSTEFTNLMGLIVFGN